MPIPSFSFTPSNSNEAVQVRVLRDDQKLITLISPPPPFTNPPSAAHQTLLDNAAADLKSVVPDALDRVPVDNNQPVGIMRSQGTPHIDQGLMPPASLIFWMPHSVYAFAQNMGDSPLLQALGKVVEDAITQKQAQQAAAMPIDPLSLVTRIKDAMSEIMYKVDPFFGQSPVSDELKKTLRGLQAAFVNDQLQFSQQDADSLAKALGQLPPGLGLDSHIKVIQADLPRLAKVRATAAAGVNTQNIIDRLTKALIDVVYLIAPPAGFAKVPVNDVPLRNEVINLKEAFIADPPQFTVQQAIALEKALIKLPIAVELANPISIIQTDLPQLMQATGRDGQYKAAKGHAAAGRKP